MLFYAKRNTKQTIHGGIQESGRGNHAKGKDELRKKTRASRLRHRNLFFPRRHNFRRCFGHSGAPCSLPFRAREWCGYCAEFRGLVRIPRRPRGGCQAGRKAFFLHMAGENGKKRENREQHKSKSRVFHRNHRQNRKDTTASAIMLMMPEVNSASTVSTSPEKRAATSPGFCETNVLAGRRVSFCDISVRSAWVIF